jgi:hypothetical protein
MFVVSYWLTVRTSKQKLKTSSSWQSASWVDIRNSFTDSQEIPLILGNKKVHYQLRLKV